jgi:hypothetical protein
MSRISQTHARIASTALIALASLALAAGAAAEPTGSYAKFAQCPFTNPEASKCIYSVTEGGEVSIGNKKVPVVNPVTLQGAYRDPDTGAISKFIGASNGLTLSKTPQPVPGGLAGVVSPTGSSPLVKAVIALFFENGLTGVNATLELAKPPSAIRLSESNLAGELGVALILPLKIHLENPFLGESCDVGSSASPIMWELTSGTTRPPAPNKAIKGGGGEGEFLEEGKIVIVKDTSLVDNAWATPRASGCGGWLSPLIDPAIDSSLELPVAAGRSTATLVSSLQLTSVVAIRENSG